MKIVVITENEEIKKAIKNCFLQLNFISNISYFVNLCDAKLDLKDANYILCDDTSFKSIVSYILDEPATKVNKQVAIIKTNELISSKVLMHSIIEIKKKNNKMTLPIKNGLIDYQIDEILFFENIDRHIYVHTIKGAIRTELSLNKLKSLLEGTIFFSPYVSYFVNLSYIKCINKNNVILQNDEVIPLSQKKAAIFRKIYQQYMSILSEK